MDTGFGLAVAEPEQIIIKNEAFYPDISLADFKAYFLIDASLNNALLINFLTLSMSRCNRDLAVKQRQWQAQGARTLAQVTEAAVIGGQSEYTRLYISAVHYAAYAELLSTKERQVRTPIEANERIDSAAIYQQKSAYAIADLCGHHRIQVEAI
jgi:hypothetical protein